MNKLQQEKRIEDYYESLNEDDNIYPQCECCEEKIVGDYYELNLEDGVHLLCPCCIKNAKKESE